MKLENLIKQINKKTTSRSDLAEARSALAQSANISVDQLNNYIHQDREVIELANGDFILINGKTKIFKIGKLKGE